MEFRQALCLFILVLPSRSRFANTGLPVAALKAEGSFECPSRREMLTSPLHRVTVLSQLLGCSFNTDQNVHSDQEHVAALHRKGKVAQ